MERQQSRCKWGEITEQGENSPSQLISLTKVLGKNGKMGLMNITSMTKRNLIVMGALMIDVKGGELRE